MHLFLSTCHCVKASNESSGQGSLDGEQVEDEGEAEPVWLCNGADKVNDDGDDDNDDDSIGGDGESDDNYKWYADIMKIMMIIVILMMMKIVIMVMITLTITIMTFM